MNFREPNEVSRAWLMRPLKCFGCSNSKFILTGVDVYNYYYYSVPFEYAYENSSSFNLGGDRGPARTT